MKISKQKKNARQREFRKSSAALKLRPGCLKCGKPGSHFVPPSFGDPGFFSCAGPHAMLIAVGRKNLETRRLIPEEDRAFLVREAANYEQMIDALEEALADVARLHDLNVRAAEVLRAGVEEVRRLEAERDLAQAHVQGAQAAYVSSSDLRARNLNRALEAEAVIDRVKEARGQHPECAEHPEGDATSCGWKRAVLDIDAALGIEEE